MVFLNPNPTEILRLNTDLLLLERIHHLMSTYYVSGLYTRSRENYCLHCREKENEDEGREGNGSYKITELMPDPTSDIQVPTFLHLPQNVSLTTYWGKEYGGHGTRPALWARGPKLQVWFVLGFKSSGSPLMGMAAWHYQGNRNPLVNLFSGDILVSPLASSSDDTFQRIVFGGSIPQGPLHEQSMKAQ